MTGLVTFANNGGLGLSHPQDIFKWNNGGTDGALDSEEGDGYGSGWLDHDCGYYPAWVNETAITNIRFKVEEKCTVILNVCTIQGRLVANLVSREYSPGDYDIQFSAEGLSSGIYFYSFQAGRFTDIRKMMILE